MHVILLALGAIGAVAGAALLALHQPVDPVTLGHMVVVVGAIALAGGAVVAGQAASNRELRRIVHLLEPRPSPRAAETGPELPSLDATAPRLEPTLRAAPDAPPATDKKPPDALRVDPVIGADRTSDAAPLSATGVQAVDLDPPIEEVAAPPVEPPPQPAAEKSVFDTMWSTQDRDGHERASEPHHPATAAPRSARDKNATVFKSGVIDGMAYTLYTDGSIEAELPQGTVRFVSVEELRDYLEGAGGERR